MAKHEKIEIGALNITMQPHSPELYRKLFDQANKRRRPIRLNGDKRAILHGGIGKVKSKQSKTGPVTGSIFRWTHIDMADDWYNMLTNEPATNEDLKGVNIPEYLRPNSSLFTYIFYPEGHKLFYEAKYPRHKLSPTIATKFFHELFKDDVLFNEFGRVDVTHVPAKETISEMMELTNKDSIVIEMTRPNPDNFSGRRSEIKDRYNKMNVARSTTEYRSKKGEDITPDDNLIAEANIAAENGSVAVSRLDEDGLRQTVSTKDHPMLEADYVESQPILRTTKIEEMCETMKAELDARAKALQDLND